MYEISVLRSVTLYTKKKCSQHWNVLYIKSCLSWSHWDLILLYTIKQKIQKNAAPNILHDKICSRVLWWSHWPCWNCIVSLRLHPVISVYSQYLIWTWGITYPPTASPIAYATNSISHLQDGSIVLQCPPPPRPLFIFCKSFNVWPVYPSERLCFFCHIYSDANSKKWTTGHHASYKVPR